MRIRCLRTNQSFLVDSGASISIIPKSANDTIDPWHNLKAANGTIIKTFGTEAREILLDPRLPLWHQFVRAEIDMPILGADFLAKHELVVNMKAMQLTHQKTGITLQGTQTSSSVHAVMPLHCKEAEDILRKVPNVIYKEGEPMPPPHPDAPYLEIITEGTLPQFRPRRLNPKLLKEAKEHFDDLIKRKRVSESTAPCSTPLHAVPKADGSTRFCGDYRFLNLRTIPNRYSLPYLSDSTSQMAGMKIFSKLDIKSAFEHLPVHPRDIDKTTVCTPFGNFRYHFANYGLRNSAQTFQMFIDRVLRNLTRTDENGKIHKINIYAYVDDLLLSSVDELSHQKDLEALLKRLSEFNIKLNLKKCQFFKKNLEFLGHIFCAEGIKPTEAKVQAVLNYPRPATLGGMKRFLGMVNFYFRFIKDAAGTMAPLNRLLRGYKKTLRLKKIDWNDKCVAEAFEKTKRALADSTLLAYPKIDAKIGLFCDSSDESVASILAQQDSDGFYEPLGFYSSSLNNTEKKYPPFKKN